MSCTSHTDLGFDPDPVTAKFFDDYVRPLSPLEKGPISNYINWRRAQSDIGRRIYALLSILVKKPHRLCHLNEFGIYCFVSKEEHESRTLSMYPECSLHHPSFAEGSLVAGDPKAYRLWFAKSSHMLYHQKDEVQIQQWKTWKAQNGDRGNEWKSVECDSISLAQLLDQMGVPNHVEFYKDHNYGAIVYSFGGYVRLMPIDYGAVESSVVLSHGVDTNDLPSNTPLRLELLPHEEKTRWEAKTYTKAELKNMKFSEVFGDLPVNKLK